MLFSDADLSFITANNGIPSIKITIAKPIKEVEVLVKL
tara:strand:- start:745 stop:858 length:114 start_codon:yes stop_codon:yes gene_type:complete